MEGALLSRVCLRELGRFVEKASLNGWDIGRLQLRFVRNVGGGRLGPHLHHLVPSWEGIAGDRYTAGRCLCRQVENPDRRKRDEASR